MGLYTQNKLFSDWLWLMIHFQLFVRYEKYILILINLLSLEDCFCDFLVANLLMATN